MHRKGTVALLQQDWNFTELRRDGGRGPRRRTASQPGTPAPRCFHNSKRLDDGAWTWRYDAFRTAAGFDNLWDDVPRLTLPTTLVRGALSPSSMMKTPTNSARTAPGFQKVHIVPNAATRYRATSRAR